MPPDAVPEGDEGDDGDAGDAGDLEPLVLPSLTMAEVGLVLGVALPLFRWVKSRNIPRSSNMFKKSRISVRL